MKVKVTKKQTKALNPIKLYNGKDTFLVSGKSPVFYYSNTSGWQYDVYFVAGRAVCVGYDPVGQEIPTEKREMYADEAMKIVESYDTGEEKNKKIAELWERLLSELESK